MRIRALNVSSKSVKMTDEDYESMSAGNQLLAGLAEALGIVPLIAEYNGNKYVSRETIEAIHEALQESELVDAQPARRTR